MRAARGSKHTPTRLTGSMESRTKVRVYRPTRAAFISAAVYDLFAVAPGIVSLLIFHDTALQRLGGIAVFLLGASTFFSTWHVMRTYIAVDGTGIVSANPAFALRMDWEQITAAQVRSRGIGQQPGRADRLLVFHAPGAELPLVINSSVLAPDDEQALLAEVREKVRCQIKEREDGPGR